METDFTDPAEPADSLGFGLIEALLAIAGALAALIAGELTPAGIGFGLALAVLSSRLSRLPSPRARRLGLIGWTAVAATIVLLLAGLERGGALVSVAALVAMTLVVVRAGRRGRSRAPKGD